MLAGSLTEFSLPDVFSLLAATRKSGVLNLRSGPAGAAAGRVWVAGGRIAFAVADVTRSPLAARLLHGGEIEPDAVEALIRAQAEGDGVRLVEALQAAGVPAERTTTLLHDQVVDATFDLTRWPGGDFSFDAQAPDAAATTSATTFDASEIMVAVEARMVEWEGIVATLPSPASVLRLVSRPPTRDGLIVVDPAQWEVLTLVDGVRPVTEIIRLTGQGQYTVAKLLSALVASGLVALAEAGGDRSATHQRADHLSRVEHEVLGAPLPAAVVASSATAAPATAAEPTGADQTETGETSTDQEFEDLLGRISTADDEPAAPSRADHDDAERDDIDIDVLLGGDATAPQDDPAPQAEADEDSSMDDDLLTRLMNGVKGA